MGITEPANNEPLLQNNDTMPYRPFGKTGLMVSALSFGCMRLSENQDLNTRLILKAVELGINYFETTRHYLEGTCQQKTAPGLPADKQGLIVSGKGGINAKTTAYHFRKEIERQLDILGLTHFKFYQVGWFSWALMKHLLKRGGVLDAIRRAQDEGLVHHIGFTGHDSPENFIRCLETGLFDSITIPYNLINRSYEPTIKRAGELGVGVVAMCPVAGGLLDCESELLKKEFGMNLPTVEMALRFVLANPAVSTVCSGMNAMVQLEQNVATVKNFTPDTDTHATLCEALEKMRNILGDKFCTTCRYCMPCPQNVNIPRYMKAYQYWKCFGLKDWARKTVAETPKEQQASHCNDCGECEEKCPNDLPIRERLQELSKL
ncbi:MAG: aldo/keto reductase [Planctomycetes bacterium]|nr:aldo/keto reductase [Planctomycetota bacterium]